MPRQARVIVPGLPHHIVQRGHNKQPVFIENRDFQYYLDNLQEWKHTLGLEVFSYCLMTNHVHLVVKATDELTAIPQLMKRLAGRQTRFVNKIEKRTGSLWEGRYKISPIDTDHYLLSCCRYVELNPVKAGMVDAAEHYPWSSYAARIGLADCDGLDEPPTMAALGTDSQSRRERYQAFVSDGAFSEQDRQIRAAIARNKLTSGHRFVDEVERRIGLRIETRAPGRPRK
ncbi:putative transposase [Marinobacter segnicrescens]|uniref:Putative transposase n=1 Tax=Marinobacter segnicrescens TaxID=430453 RepID=A0A1I0IB09_9GAMM|nr:transposase [Marinobacter segnicrescens]SET93094.1 putative transposase [Marinobacter segnicrescens]